MHYRSAIEEGKRALGQFQVMYPKQQQQAGALEIREVSDNYIQIGPDSTIQAGTKTSKPEKDNVYEVVDPEENFQSDLELLQDKMRLMLHDS